MLVEVDGLTDDGALEFAAIDHVRLEDEPLDGSLVEVLLQREALRRSIATGGRGGIPDRELLQLDGLVAAVGATLAAYEVRYDLPTYRAIALPCGVPTEPLSAAASFRAMHQTGCFLLPNPWDRGSAIILARLGFHALATSSAGAAFTRGLPDDVRAMPCAAMLAHIQEIVEATPLPVNADFQAGYADDLETLAANVTACVATGAAGLSLEDATGDPTMPLYAREEAIARVRSARAAIDKTGASTVLTARCEAWLVGDPNPERTAIDRLVAFAEAGADCLYAPGVRDPATIATLVRAVAPRPLNVLMAAHHPELGLGQLAQLGVRRVSLGSALARAAWGGFLRAARGLVDGDFSGLAGAASFAELDAMFRVTR